MSFDQERVKQIIADAMIEFGKEYAIGYVKAVVKKIQAEIEGRPSPPLALLVKPPVPDVLKEGWITKKRRYCEKLEEAVVCDRQGVSRLLLCR
jgi:hypothetical protein